MGPLDARRGCRVSNAMMDCVVAACSQMGDLGRAFESFEAYKELGLKPDAQAFNAVISGCIAQGITSPVPKVLSTPSGSPEPSQLDEEVVSGASAHASEGFVHA